MSQPQKVIIVVAGKKGAGKNTIGNQIAAAVLNATNDPDQYQVRQDGRLWLINNGHAPASVEEGVKDNQVVHSPVRTVAFASPIKEFCVNVIGLRPEQVYGTDAQKNTVTDVQWDNLPLKVRWASAKRKWLKPSTWLRSGCMTAREVQQVLGTEKMRAWIPDVWARAGYMLAMRRREPIIVITDCRFPNEVEAKREFQFPHKRNGAVIGTILTTRQPYTGDLHASELALDNYPRDRFDLVIDSDLGLEQQDELVRIFLVKLLSQAGHHEMANKIWNTVVEKTK